MRFGCRGDTPRGLVSATCKRPLGRLKRGGEHAFFAIAYGRYLSSQLALCNQFKVLLFDPAVGMPIYNLARGVGAEQNGRPAMAK